MLLKNFISYLACSQIWLNVLVGEHHLYCTVFLLPILSCSQSGYDPQEDLAKFGNNLNKRVIFLKHPSIVLATHLNHV
jgi:hypothetical protein